jgi:magnesium transporter
MGTMRLVVDSRDGGPPAEADLSRLGELLCDSGSRVWLDIADPGPTEVSLLKREFGFHELALDEVTRPHERPRCESYGRYYFVVVYAAESVGDTFLARELNLFWSENYLVTIHRRHAAVVAVLEEARRRWVHGEGREAFGVAALAYALFDAMVEGYFVVQDRVRERIEHIEAEIFKGADTAAAELFGLRKELLRVPRLLAPTSHVLAEVLRRERGIPEGLRPYFGDVQDHAVHVLAELDTYRDLLGAALDVQAFYAFNRLGRIMQRLTAITVIILVPNFVASIFGMNFAHIPASQSEFAFLAVVVLLGIMVAWGFIHSRILGWL